MFIILRFDYVLVIFRNEEIITNQIYIYMWREYEKYYIRS